MTNEEYYLKYGKEFMPKEWDANEHDPLYGNAKNTNSCLECSKPVKFDEGHWEYPVFCGSVCSVLWTNRNTNRTEKAWNTIREKQEIDPNFRLTPTQKQYWINKGCSEEEAEEFVSVRQSTNTLERFIERAGGDVQKGTEAWAERQQTWLMTIIANGTFSGISAVSGKMFDELAKHVSGLRYAHDEVVIRAKEKLYKVDCLLLEKRKIIEFHGDYWHGNPEKYGPDDLICKKIPVKEKWEKDARRKANIEAAGFDVLVIWESDYASDPEGVIQKCIEFLNEKERIGESVG